MIGLLALAAVTADCAHAYRRQLPPVERAQCYYTRLSPYPELVRFRNVRSIGDMICGEVNYPGTNRMAGFHQFGWRDENNWVEKHPAGYFGRIAGRTNGSAMFDERASRGGALEKQAQRERKLAFEAKANELLGACTA